MVQLNFPGNVPSVKPKYEKVGQGHVHKIHVNLKSSLMKYGFKKTQDLVIATTAFKRTINKGLMAKAHEF